MKKTCVAAMLLSVSLVGCQQATWSEYSSPEGEFSVLMPGTPTKQIRSVQTASGPLDAHMFLVEHGGVAYMVAFSDYPTMVIQDRPSQLILDGARDGAVANANGKLLGESMVSLNGHQGRELDIEPMGGKVTIRARIFLVDHRLYQVMVLTPKGKDFSGDVRKFLDSFSLRPELPTPQTHTPTPKT